MIISHGHRYIFVHIPKTGGTALSLALEGSVGRDDILVGDTPKARRRRRRLARLPHFSVIGKHSMLAQIELLLPDDALAGYRVITIVRNPWARLVSLYHWSRVQRFEHPIVAAAKSTGFSDFLRAPSLQQALMAQPYSRFLTTQSGEYRDDLVLHQERLAQDVSDMCEMLSLKLSPLETINASARPEDWRSQFSIEDRQLDTRIDHSF